MPARGVGASRAAIGMVQAMSLVGALAMALGLSAYFCLVRR